MATLYLRVDDDTYIEFDETTRVPRAMQKSALRQELDFLRGQRDSLPPQPTNAELLAWAKEHYPQYSETGLSRQRIKARIDEIQALLDAMKV